MLEPKVKDALLGMAVNFDKHLGERGLTLWEGELEGFASADILTAIRSVMDDPEVKHMPRTGELKARIPRSKWPKGAAADGPKLAWYDLEGNWGGDWSKCHDPDELGYIWRYVQRVASPHTDLSKFLRFLESKGANTKEREALSA